MIDIFTGLSGGTNTRNRLITCDFLAIVGLVV